MAKSVDQAHAEDRSRIETLPLFNLKFVIHKEYDFATGHNGEDSEHAYEKEEVIFQVNSVGGWNAINDVARYIKDSCFMAYDSSVTDVELVGIEKVESKILNISTKTLFHVRAWLDEETKKRKKRNDEARKAFSPVTAEDIAAL